MKPVVEVLRAICSMFLEVILFWYGKFTGRWTRKSEVDVWIDALHNAETYDDWERAALQLDDLKGLNIWRDDPSSRSYDWVLINERLNSIITARAARDVGSLLDLVRSGLVRNLGNITAPRLYNRAFAGTKYLIEEYVAQVAGAIEDIDAWPTAAAAPPPSRDAQPQHVRATNTATATAAVTTAAAPLSTQRKLDFLHDSRQALGRSALVLQGGAIFGLCHLGVIRALFLRGLLPRIIVGTATGALVASLVSVHTEEELPRVLRGDGIDLSAFEAHGQLVHGGGDRDEKGRAGPGSWFGGSKWETFVRRAGRLWREGYLLDVKVLEECVKANVGDLTFEEAYNRSKRVLNITVAMEGGREGVPTLLNYITAPNVLIWTAAIASNASAPSLYGRRQMTTVLCRDAGGRVVPWAPSSSSLSSSPSSSSSSSSSSWDKDRKSPLTRVAQLFNVNHFVVSQARPYLVPFLQSDMHGPSPPPSLLSRMVLLPGSGSIGGGGGGGGGGHRHRYRYRQGPDQTAVTSQLFRVVGLELRHRLHQLDALGLLPAGIRRFLVDEEMPGDGRPGGGGLGGAGAGAGTSTAVVTLVPDVAPADFPRLLLDTPTRGSVDGWIRRGERSVWPAVGALAARCAVELELDRAYQRARRLKAGGLRRKASTAGEERGAGVVGARQLPYQPGGGSGPPPPPPAPVTIAVIDDDDDDDGDDDDDDDNNNYSYNSGGNTNAGPAVG